MLAEFTVMLAELESAAETALRLEARTPKIALAIGRPVEGDGVFKVVSWIVDGGRLDLPAGVACGEALYALRFSRFGVQAPGKTLCDSKRYCMKLGPSLLNVGEEW